MNKLLFKIILSRQGKWQFIFAGLGFATGMLILLLSVQLYLDLRHIFVGDEKKEASTYLILNKEISLLNTFDRSLSGFTKEEVVRVDSQECFISTGPFLRNNFSIEIDLKMQLGFSTDLFLESVPDNFIDNMPERFVWSQDTSFLPVIISSEFLNIYNFGYALTQGLPQLPPLAVQMMPFNLTVKGHGKKKKLSAQIVGFSERIPSVLVPDEFMIWANEKYGKGASNPSRLIVEVQDPGDERIAQFLAENKYLTNKEKLIARNSGKLFRMIVLLTVSIGALFVALSFVIFIINFQLVIAKAKREIDILLNLGYTIGSITKILNTQLAMMLSVILALIVLLLYFVIQQIQTYLAEGGVTFESTVSLPVIIIALTLTFVMLLLNHLTLRFTLR